ncbi:hypothetical protein Leryth_018936 [Lithospermum erythrorhizon]|nr:hypothetical protein Leryth_018936 [Lithospermum erythrorhizon]
MVQDLQAHPPLHNTTTTTSPPPPCTGRSCPWWPYSSSKDFTSNAAIILTILFSALFIALALNAAIRYFIRRRATTQEDNDVEAGEQEGGMKVVFSPGMKVGEKETTECAICLSEFAQGDVIRVLDKCNHGFHYQCVQKWLVSHSSCPTCRANCK